MSGELFVGLIAGVTGLVLGMLLTWLWSRSRLGVLQERLGATEREVQAAAGVRQENEQLKIQLAEERKERESQAEKLLWVDHAQEQLRDTFQSLASQTLQANTGYFLTQTREHMGALQEQLQGVVDPLTRNLGTLDGYVRELEQKREGAYQGLQEQMRQLATTHSQLQATTVTLAQAMKSTSSRGRWGEIQLHRVVEMAGMVEHVDFEEQKAAGDLRPDMTIVLPNGGFVPVDSKAPMNAYLEAIEALQSADQKTYDDKMKKHIAAIEQKVRDLAEKAYWRQFEKTPDFVVMFMPSEACLCAALEHKPDLLEAAMQQHVLITTPVTLLALLKAVAYGWQQQQITMNAREIAAQGRELYERLTVFANHLCNLSKSLNDAVQDYNKAMNSLTSRVMPAASRFSELGLVTAALPAPDQVDHQAIVIELSDGARQGKKGRTRKARPGIPLDNLPDTADKPPARPKAATRRKGRETNGRRGQKAQQSPSSGSAAQSVPEPPTQ
jgi:DNA recombination protein RmuC